MRARARTYAPGALLLPTLIAAQIALAGAAALAQDGETPRARPPFSSNRWQEDWSALADPALRTEAIDALKYLSLSASDPRRYLSLGVTLRERYEANDAAGLGAGGNSDDAWLLQRLQLHADLHLDAQWRVFAQLEDDRAFGKRAPSTADQDRVDLRLAFAELVRPLGGGVFKARLGRQDFAFDLQRFVSSRDGPNVRQSFDAAWADWETPDWRVLGFVSQPVQYRDDHPFDDHANAGLRFSTLRVERHVLGSNELSAYYALYQRDAARYGDAAGREQRHVGDARFAGSDGGFDWDLEAMLQTGHVGASRIQAGALGTRVGERFAAWPGQPRVGLQVDVATGDRHAGDGRVGTFNPLFPNGYYFTLAGYTGYANLLHVKPSLTLKPAAGLTLMAATGAAWRQTTADSVYVQPNLPLAGTAGQGRRWTGLYEQLRADWAVDRHWGAALEAVRYQAGAAVRGVGGRDSNYVGVEMKAMW